MRADTAEQTCEVVTTPFWVSRVNLFPYLELRDEAGRLRRTAAALDGLVLEADRRRALAPRLLDQLHAWAPLVDDAERRAFVLPLKRDVFNGRPSRQSVLEHPSAERLEGFAEWAGSWAATAVLEALVDDAQAAAETAEREVLGRWSADADVQRSIAVTSPDLLSAIHRRDRTATPDRRTRKSEAALVQYFSRSTVRVSPFSLYTGVHLQDVDAAPVTGGPLTRTSIPALRRLMVRHAARRLVEDPLDSRDVPWRVTDAHAVVDGTLVVRRRQWKEPSRGMKADTFTEDEVRVPLSESLAAVLGLLSAQTSGLPHGVLEAELHDAFGWDDRQSGRLLRRLVEIGLLVPAFPVSERSAAFEAEWLEVLAPMTGQASAAMREALLATTESLPTFEVEAGVDRARTLGRLTELWSAAVGSAVDNPVVEDAYVSRGLDVEPARLQRWVDDSTDLLPLLAAHDDQRVLAGALETVFVERYGHGGRCTDLRELATVAYACFPLTQRLLSGERPTGLSPTLVHLLDARAVAVEHLVALSREDRDEVHLDPARLADVAARVPQAELEVPRSVSLFGQRDGDRFVLNHIYGGRARYFSRYLDRADPRVTETLRRHNERLVADGALALHMRPSLGFNANLGPLLAPTELGLTDEVRPADGAPTIDDLHLVHTATGLRLRTASDDRDVDLLYTGFLVPHALPSEQMLLAMLAGAPYFSFSDLQLDLHARWTGGEPGRERGTARIISGDLVLFRRRWAMPSEFFEVRPGESAQHHFRRVNEARLARGIPDQVFVRPLFGRQITPVERAMSPKPQHVDFLSRIQLGHAPRRLANLGPMLVAEEFSPHPSSGVRSTLGEHATEMFFEINTRRRQS